MASDVIGNVKVSMDKVVEGLTVKVTVMGLRKWRGEIVDMYVVIQAWCENS